MSRPRGYTLLPSPFIVSQPTAVETVDVEAAAPVDYTIDGVQVENLTKGLYIKVIGSKAIKVIF